MKSITVTTHRAKNYGAVLQAYALQKTLLSLGHDNYILDGAEEAGLYAKINISHLKSAMINITLNITTFFRYKKMSRFYKGFTKFVDERLKLTEKYKLHNENQEDILNADCYITGSDQMFSFSGSDEQINQWFLNFGSKNILRYSFATSLGEYNLDDKKKEYMAKALSTYQKVSVREKQAKEYIESFSNIECDVHLDPVFLLDKKEWSELAIKPRVKDKYILCFPLLGNDYLQKVVDKIKKEMKLPVVCIQTIAYKRIRADKYIFDASPEEFLGLIKNASMVITTSFHGTALSVLFERPFYTLIKSYKPQRMQNLLQLLEITNHLLSDDKFDLELDIDYTQVTKIIELERKRSFDYLTNLGKN